MSMSNQKMSDSLMMKRKGSFTPSTVSQKYQVSGASGYALQRQNSQTEHPTTRTAKPLGTKGSQKRSQQNYDSQNQLSGTRQSQQYSSMQ